MELPFTKMHGLGNDFVLIDERRFSYGLQTDQLRHIADRRLGIGCDQILFLDPAQSKTAAARYRIANADGSPAEHCGNGIRCVARYLQQRREIANEVSIEVGEAVFVLTLSSDGIVRVDMGAPRFAPTAIPFSGTCEAASYDTTLGDEHITFGAVSVGNPHATILVDDAATANVGVLGPALQASALFPQGVNVGFMEIQSPTRVQLRVYERGAGETRACGTGACAAVVIGRRWQRLDAKVEVFLTGGKLEIEWPGGADDSIWMSGPATYVYDGTISL